MKRLAIVLLLGVLSAGCSHRYVLGFCRDNIGKPYQAVVEDHGAPKRTETRGDRTFLFFREPRWSNYLLVETDAAGIVQDCTISRGFLER